MLGTWLTTKHASYPWQHTYHWSVYIKPESHIHLSLMRSDPKNIPSTYLASLNDFRPHKRDDPMLQKLRHIPNLILNSAMRCSKLCNNTGNHGMKIKGMAWNRAWMKSCPHHRGTEGQQRWITPHIWPLSSACGGQTHCSRPSVFLRSLRDKYPRTSGERASRHNTAQDMLAEGPNVLLSTPMPRNVYAAVFTVRRLSGLTITIPRLFTF